MSELATIITAIAVAATAIAGICGGTWKVWSQIRTEIADLRKKVEDCATRDADKDRNIHTMGVCLRLLIPEVVRLDPGNHTLTQVAALLDRSFPIDDDTPPEMLAMLRELDGVEARPRKRRAARP